MTGPAPIPPQKTTLRPILGGQLSLTQPLRGYRSAIEPILLAASCDARSGQRILDIGCGVGTAGLCLAKRVAGVQLTGVDIQPALVHLAQENAFQNGLEKAARFICADITALPPHQLERGSFHHVITNPPFYTPQEADKSPYENKEISHIESTTPLASWIELGVKYLRSHGTLTVVYTANRMAALMHAMVENGLGAIDILPLWPRAGQPAKRALLRGKKCRKTGTRLLGGLVLHAQETYTAQTKAILDGGASLEWC